MEIIIKTYDDGWTPYSQMHEQGYAIKNTSELALLLDKFQIYMIHYLHQTLIVYVFDRTQNWPQ